MNISLYLRFSILFLLLLSCQKEDDPGAISTKCPKLVLSDLIIGNNDWIQANQTGDDSQNLNELTVAQVKIPSMLAVCTGFLINEDTLMTNHHCIGSAGSASNVTALFRNADNSRTSFVCDQFIATSIQYDFTLVKCKNTPGNKFGWVGLSNEKPEKYSPIYVVQENCDYLSDPHCLVNKYVSFGETLDSQTTRIYHDADTLAGSSGSPIFSEDTHQVIAIHNAASYGDSTVSDRNAGVPMYQIRNIIETTTSVAIHEFGTAKVFPIPDVVLDPIPDTIPPAPTSTEGTSGGIEVITQNDNCEA